MTSNISTHSSTSSQEFVQSAARVQRPQRAGPVLLGLLLAVTPFCVGEYWITAILIPWLILSLAGLGLNILTGYAGQTSLGSAAFMAVGAFSAYNLLLRVPGLPLPAAMLGAGLITAAVGYCFGIPSSRIRGFYLMVSTLAAQFFIEWVLGKFPWFSNGASGGSISAPALALFGISLKGPLGRYYLTLGTAAVLVTVASRLLASQTGREWCAIRDMDTAASVIGIDVRQKKLLAFSVSSFYLGVAGVLWAFAYLGSASAESFTLARSFQILFIIIIGGLGHLWGSVVGAAIISLFPLLLNEIGRHIAGGMVDPGLLQNVQKALFGSLIIWLLAKEPEGVVHLLSNLGRLRPYTQPQANGTDETVAPQQT